MLAFKKMWVTSFYFNVIYNKWNYECYVLQINVRKFSFTEIDNIFKAQWPCHHMNQFYFIKVIYN